MIAGKLDTIIEIHSPTFHKNEYGEVEDNVYEKAYQTKAQVTYNSGSRMVENNEIFNEYKVCFTIRIYNKVSEIDRVKYDGKFYIIESIETSRQYQLKRLQCKVINE